MASLALALLWTISGSNVALSVPEPGLMLLPIILRNGMEVEAYSLSAAKETGSRRSGLFLAPGTPQEQEFYANAADQAIGMLQEELPAESDSSASAVTG